METEILAELVQIKWVLVATFFAIFLAVLFVLAVMAFRIRETNSNALLLRRDNLLAELAIAEAKGDYEQMLAKSSQMLKTYHHDLMANWYNAIAHYKTGSHGAALSTLGRIKEINRSWSVETVDDLISEIQSEMAGPQAQET